MVIWYGFNMAFQLARIGRCSFCMLGIKFPVVCVFFQRIGLRPKTRFGNSESSNDIFLPAWCILLGIFPEPRVCLVALQQLI